METYENRLGLHLSEILPITVLFYEFPVLITLPATAVSAYITYVHINMSYT